MKNIVASAVNNLMNGAANAPTVPTALTHPKVNESTLEGKSSATYTKNNPHILFKTNRRHAKTII
jgi:hypothetical protein